MTPSDEPVVVRVLGIDCPESHDNTKCRRDGRTGGTSCAEQVPRGLAASLWARHTLEGKVVTADSDSKRDRYGRALLYLRLDDGRDYGLASIRAGYCVDFGWKYPHPRMAAYVTAQLRAELPRRPRTLARGAPAVRKD